MSFWSHVSSVSINTATTQLLSKAQKPMVYMFPQWKNIKTKKYIKRHSLLLGALTNALVLLADTAMPTAQVHSFLLQ